MLSVSAVSIDTAFCRVSVSLEQGFLELSPLFLKGRLLKREAYFRQIFCELWKGRQPMQIACSCG